MNIIFKNLINHKARNISRYFIFIFSFFFKNLKINFLVTSQLTTNENKKNFKKTSTQRKFVTKVYMLLGLQCICYLLLACIVHAVPAIISFQKSNDYLIFVAILTIFCILYTVAYFPLVFRNSNTAFAIYGVFTFFFSYILSFSIHYYNPQNVLTWLILSCSVVLSLLIYSMITTSELSILYGFLYVFGAVLVFGLAVGFYFREGLWGLLTLCFWNLIFGLYLVYDVKEIIRNVEGRYCLDDFVLATMSLYIDLFGIIIYVLKIISNKG